MRSNRGGRAETPECLTKTPLSYHARRDEPQYAPKRRAEHRPRETDGGLRKSVAVARLLRGRNPGGSPEEGPHQGRHPARGGHATAFGGGGATPPSAPVGTGYDAREHRAHQRKGCAEDVPPSLRSAATLMRRPERMRYGGPGGSVQPAEEPQNNNPHARKQNGQARTAAAKPGRRAHNYVATDNPPRPTCTKCRPAPPRTRAAGPKPQLKRTRTERCKRQAPHRNERTHAVSRRPKAQTTGRPNHPRTSSRQSRSSSDEAGGPKPERTANTAMTNGRHPPKPSQLPGEGGPIYGQGPAQRRNKGGPTIRHHVHGL